jgi:hypothetical protein
MEIRKSRVQNKAQAVSVGAKTESLIRALNDDFGGRMKGNRKVVDTRALLVLVKRFQELDMVVRDRSIPLFWQGHDGKTVDSPEVMRKYRTVNRFLCRYAASPVILPEHMTDLNPLSRGWLFHWKQTGRREQPFMELGFVLTIVNIAAVGRISSLKQSANCRRWLLARFPHQRFCNESCKETFHRTNEADKKRRREWAKNNYWLHRNKNVK